MITTGATVPVVVVVALLAAAVAVLLAVAVLRRLPEPSPDDHDPGGATRKPTYRGLVRPSFLIMVGVFAAATATVAVIRLEPTQWAPWLVLAVFGSVLAMIDSATTWLPNEVMHPFWIAMTVALLIMIMLGERRNVVSVLVGGAAWMLVFWLVWAISRQLGFGDVRLALGLGAAAGAAGWVTIYTCLFAGTLVGALWGVLHRARRGRQPGPFPYGMALFLGCPIGLALTPR